MIFPTFDDAVGRFRDFLVTQGVPGRIVWVAPESTILCGQEWKIFDDGGLKDREVRSVYEAAKAKGVGVYFSVLCSDGDTSYCYLHVPIDEYEAVNMGLDHGGVKMSIPVDISKATVIRRGLLSLWFQLRELRVKKFKKFYFRQS